MASTKPVIWTIDDDPTVLRAIERDLRHQYSNRYRIMAADSGEAALLALAELKLRNDPVAFFLVDQRMPGVSGVEPCCICQPTRLPDGKPVWRFLHCQIRGVSCRRPER